MPFSERCTLSSVEDMEYLGQCFPSEREKGEQLWFAQHLQSHRGRAKQSLLAERSRKAERMEILRHF